MNNLDYLSLETAQIAHDGSDFVKREEKNNKARSSVLLMLFGVLIGVSGTCVWNVRSSPGHEQIVNKLQSASVHEIGGENRDNKEITFNRMDLVSQENFDSTLVVPANVESSGWVRIPGHLKQVSLAQNGAIWGIAQSGSIWVSPGHCGTPVSFFGWDQVPGKLNQISVGGVYGNIAVGVTTSHAVYARRGITVGATKGTSWSLLHPHGTLSHVSVSSNALWGLESNTGKAWVRVHGQSWRYTGISSMKRISAGGDNVVAISKTLKLYEYVNMKWSRVSPIPDAVIWASKAADGEYWIVTIHHKVYRWSTTTKEWVLIPGSMTQVDVASKNMIVAVNSEGQIFLYH